MIPDFGKLGFGFLRLPHTDPNDITDVDLKTTGKMVDLFLSRGFSYFDTAYIYLNGKSEAILKEVLVNRYPRQAYQIATKLPCGLLEKGKTPEEIFSQQLNRCGVDFFDVYLLHGLDAEDAEIAEKHGCFAFLQQQKELGKIRYTGFSFHDSAEVLDDLLTRHPEVDLVQIQLNYLDWEHPIIQSGACWEVCRKHNKPMIIMEPVKGGTLADIPAEAEKLLQGEKPAHRALRFAASQEGVALVLSGMSTVSQVEENTDIFTEFAPLKKEETAILPEVAEIIRKVVAISCTGCAYCVEHCPAKIPIPNYFSLYNEQKKDGWQVNARGRYQELTKTHPEASACISCKSCEARCPQKLPISALMKEVSAVFDRKQK